MMLNLTRSNHSVNPLSIFFSVFFSIGFFFSLYSQQYFSATGVNQTYTVPANVYSINLYMWGAGGGGGDNLHGSNAHGGGGGFVSGVLCVTPGEQLTIIVGKGGKYKDDSANTTYGGGGSGGNNNRSNDSGAGGGRSAIRRGNLELATAGAGGGLVGRSGGSYNGIVIPGGAGGRAGTQSAGGAGGIGAAAAEYIAGRGSSFQGGNGQNLSGRGGGGGGGGYFGGGGAAGRSDDFGAGGGGGGSSYYGGLTNVVTISGGDGDIPNQSQQNAGNFSHIYNNSTYGKGGSVGQNGQDGRIVIEPIYTDAGPDKSICLGEEVQLEGGIVINYSYPNNITYNWSGGPIVSGGNTLTPIVKPTTTTTYTLNGQVNGCAFSDEAQVFVTLPVGDTTVFGQNLWNVYAFDEVNPNYNSTTLDKYLKLDPNILMYKGFYIDNSFNINTENQWNGNSSPSFAPSYQGCTVKNDNHVFVYKREGFPCGTYQINDIVYDDAIQIIVDGVTIYRSAVCCNGNVNQTLQLDGRSKVEIRVGENQGLSRLIVDFVPIAVSLSNNNNQRTCYVKANSGWNTFTLLDGKTLVSINPGASTLGDVIATSYVSSTPILVDACAPIYDHQTAVLGRRWTINPTIQPTNPVNVRLYFSENEYLPLIPLSNSSSNPDDQTASINDLRLSKYHHPTNIAVNGDFNDNCANIPSGSMSIHNQLAAGNANTHLTGFDAIGRFVEFQINNFSEFWLHGSQLPSPLAVEISELTATCEGQRTTLSWKTISEKNADQFIIRSSVDGKTWIEEGRVQAAGTTTDVQNYSFQISTSRKKYVQLTQVDFDGETTVYDPIFLNCESFSKEVMIYPNPNNGKFTLVINSGEDLDPLKLQILGMDGKVIMSSNFNVKKGVNNIQIESQDLTKGSYIIHVTGFETDTFSPIKFLVQ